MTKLHRLRLDLRNDEEGERNYIGEEGARKLGEALCHMPELLQLKVILLNTDIGEKGAENLYLGVSKLK